VGALVCPRPDSLISFLHSVQFQVESGVCQFAGGGAVAVPLQAGGGVIPGIGSFRRGTGREPGILTRLGQSRGGGCVGVSRDLPVGVFRGVPRDRVPRPPRSGRRPVGGFNTCYSPAFSTKIAPHFFRPI
jgi:hypothetical protein